MYCLDIFFQLFKLFLKGIFSWFDLRAFVDYSNILHFLFCFSSSFISFFLFSILSIALLLSLNNSLPYFSVKRLVAFLVFSLFHILKFSSTLALYLFVFSILFFYSTSLQYILK